MGKLEMFLVFSSIWKVSGSYMHKVDAVYIHIPFCNYICAYCDFCKIFYNKEYVNRYLDALEQEIMNNYKGEVITSLYIGGGTPSSLDLEELEKLLKILKIFNLSKDCEITFESNADSLSLDKIKFVVYYCLYSHFVFFIRSFFQYCFVNFCLKHYRTQTF